jgi:O-antigen ligase
MTSGSGQVLREQYVWRWYYRSKQTVSIFPLAVLLVSFFYCLPLGRFSLGGFDSDFRIFDFAILFVFLYYFSKEKVTQELSYLLASRVWFIKWLKILSILILISILVSIFYSGTSFILPRLIRAYRFLAYLFVPFLVFAVVRRKSDYLLLFNLFFWLVAGVGGIAFLQALGFLPNFWPDYWRIMYSENDAPVATLSPHHKHIGVIMLVGVCIGIGYMLRVRPLWLKVIIGMSILMMFTVPLFAGTRTYLLGFAGVLPAILLIGKRQAIVPMAAMLIGATIFLYYAGDNVSSRVEKKFEERVTTRVEKLGYEGLYRERTIIYVDILQTLARYPHLLITGTGYQNIFKFIGANGAHNNYLQALMELGLTGFFVFIAFLVVLWRNLRSTTKLKDRDVSLTAQYTWVALCGILLTMFVGETFWGQAAMFTLAGQLSFLFGLAVSPLYWLKKYDDQFVSLQRRDILLTKIN